MSKRTSQHQWEIYFFPFNTEENTFSIIINIVTGITEEKFCCFIQIRITVCISDLLKILKPLVTKCCHFDIFIVLSTFNENSLGYRTAQNILHQSMSHQGVWDIYGRMNITKWRWPLKFIQQKQLDSLKENNNFCKYRKHTLYDKKFLSSTNQSSCPVHLSFFRVDYWLSGFYVSWSDNGLHLGFCI